MTSIVAMLENGSDKQPQWVAAFSLAPKQALVAYLMEEDGMLDATAYPEQIPGMWESQTVPGRWYYSDALNNRVFSSFSCKGA